MRKIVIYILVLLIVALSGEAFAAPPVIKGEAAVLLDANTGQILYGKNIHERLAMASTTKIMTGLVALEKDGGNINAMVTASKRAVSQEGTSTYLTEGEQLSLHDMLHAMLMCSANDAAVAIAEHTGGSVERFVAMMNTRARELGAKDTHFVNPNGLPADGHYTSAYDLAIIARQAMQIPEFRQIVKTKYLDVPEIDSAKYNRILINHNRFLWQYPGADGIKTGYTVAARQCIVASATRDGHQLIAVVLKTEGKNIWSDTRTLMDYGFANYKLAHVVSKGQQIGLIPVKFGDSVPAVTARELAYTFPQNAQPHIERVIKWNSLIMAPLAKGEKVGKLKMLADGKAVASVDLVAAKAVERKFYTQWWLWLLILGGGAAVIRRLQVRRRRRYWRY